MQNSASSVIIDPQPIVPAGPLRSDTFAKSTLQPMPLSTTPSIEINAEDVELQSRPTTIQTSTTFPPMEPVPFQRTLTRMKKPRTTFWMDHKILDTLLLHRIWSSHGPWWIILKAALALAMALSIDLATQNKDSVTSTFIAWLALSDVVSNGLAQSFSVWCGAMLGACIGVGLQAGLIPLSPYAVIGAVPLAVCLTVYILFLFKRENDFGALTNGAFSSLFTVIVPYTYAPLQSTVPIPVQTLVVRIISVTTGVVCGTVVNLLVSGLFYKRLFYQRHLAVARTLKFAVLDVARDPINNQYAFNLVSSCQAGIQGAIADVERIRGTRVKLSNSTTYQDLHEYEATLNTYLKLLNIYAFVGNFRNLLTKPEQKILFEICNNAYRILVDEVWGFSDPAAPLSAPTMTGTPPATPLPTVDSRDSPRDSESSIQVSSVMSSASVQGAILEGNVLAAPMPSNSDFIKDEARVLPESLTWLVKALDSVLLELAIDAHLSPGGWTAKELKKEHP